jgi:hypothetical protein
VDWEQVRTNRAFDFGDVACGCGSWESTGGGREGSMITRVAKVLLAAGMAAYYTLVVFNNLTDFDLNYQFVRHVLMTDSTYPGNHGMSRSSRERRLLRVTGR